MKKYKVYSPERMHELVVVKADSMKINTTTGRIEFHLGNDLIASFAGNCSAFLDQED